MNRKKILRRHERLYATIKSLALNELLQLAQDDAAVLQAYNATLSAVFACSRTWAGRNRQNMFSTRKAIGPLVQQTCSIGLESRCKLVNRTVSQLVKAELQPRFSESSFSALLTCIKKIMCFPCKFWSDRLREIWKVACFSQFDDFTHGVRFHEAEASSLELKINPAKAVQRG